MAGTKIALFLIGVLRDAAVREEKESERIERSWRERLEEHRESLPPTVVRVVEEGVTHDDPMPTPEQWNTLVELTGETYYAIARHTHAASTARNLEALYDAMKEAS